MTHWTDIRAHARRLHSELSRMALSPSDSTPPARLSAERLLECAADFTGIPRIPVPANDPLLYGTLATLANGCIWYNADVESWFGLCSRRTNTPITGCTTAKLTAPAMISALPPKTPHHR
jgi:hypothetical protein